MVTNLPVSSCLSLVHDGHRHMVLPLVACPALMRCRSPHSPVCISERPAAWPRHGHRRTHVHLAPDGYVTLG